MKRAKNNYGLNNDKLLLLYFYAYMADDMGLGKTVQALALLLSRVKEGPSIVAAPASVVLNWKSEMERFTPGLRPHVLGLAPVNDKKISALKSGDVLLASYGMLVSRQESLTAVKWNVACLDEAHTIEEKILRLHKVKRNLADSLLEGTHMASALTLEDLRALAQSAMD